jgi:hypothetical protein
MGSVNHGLQTITFDYYMVAKGGEFSKLFKNAIKTGLYTGGYLTRVSDTEISLSPFTMVIGDSADHLVYVKTSSAASIKTATIDSGSLDSLHPWIVLRWAFANSVNNYVEIHATTKVAIQENDIVVGKVLWSGTTITGFSCADRSEPKTQDYWLKTEETETSEMYVRVHAGRINTDSAVVDIENQKVGPFVAPASPNSRIDLVYVTKAGALAIEQGVEAVSPSAPDHGEKVVLSEVTVVNGVTNIAATAIRDTRHFMANHVSIDNYTLKYNASNKLAVNLNLIKPPYYTLKYKSGIVWDKPSDFTTWDISCDIPSYGYLEEYTTHVESRPESRMYTMKINNVSGATKLVLVYFNNSGNTHFFVDNTEFAVGTFTFSMSIPTGEHYIHIIATNTSQGQVLAQFVDGVDLIFVGNNA